MITIENYYVGNDKLSNRLKHAYDVFRGKDFTYGQAIKEIGEGSATPSSKRYHRRAANGRSIITPIYNRISMDCASNKIHHVKVDENNQFKEIVKSDFNGCLSSSANIDQTAAAFIQDLILSLFDEGVVAVVPVDTTINPGISGSYDIQSMRVGRIIQWYPKHILTSVYNDRTGKHQEVLLEKKDVGIIENPLYSIMNEPNSTLQRLIKKLLILDAIDEQSGSGKLDLIIQLPYVIKTKAREEQAELRRTKIEEQLSNSKYGVAYTDGTERITQLNRPVENNLMIQIEYLTSTLWGQLGISQSIFDGTADERTMLNYNNRTIAPLMNTIVDELTRKNLTKTARTQNQKIMWFNDPFKLVPVEKLADIADKFTRNEIFSSNEIRAMVGRKPSEDPEADELRNKNLNKPKEVDEKIEVIDKEETHEKEE